MKHSGLLETIPLDNELISLSESQECTVAHQSPNSVSVLISSRLTFWKRYLTDSNTYFRHFALEIDSPKNARVILDIPTGFTIQTHRVEDLLCLGNGVTFDITVAVNYLPCDYHSSSLSAFFSPTIATSVCAK